MLDPEEVEKLERQRNMLEEVGAWLGAVLFYVLIFAILTACAPKPKHPAWHAAFDEQMEIGVLRDVEKNKKPVDYRPMLWIE